MNKCKVCGCEIKRGDICNGCAVAEGLKTMTEILKVKPHPGVTVREPARNETETEKKN